MSLHIMRVLPFYLTLLTGCVVPGGYQDGSKDPIMSEVASANAVYSATYENFCKYDLNLAGSKIRCRGRIHLSDDGETLALVYRKTVDFVDIASGKKRTEAMASRKRYDGTVRYYPPTSVHRNRGIVTTPEAIRQKYGVQSVGWGAFGTGDLTNIHYAWYHKTSDGRGILFIADLESLEIVFEHTLEKEVRSHGGGRIPTIMLAQDVNRIAVLSTDGIVRVFDF